MTDDPKSTFAKRVRAAKPRTRKYDVWDDVISGFDLRVGTSGHRSFFLRRSVHGRIRSATIGSADTMSLPEARREARKLIATFIDPARKHNGPRTPDRPMDAFAGEFLDRQARRWKPRTLESNTYMVRKYILPAFGHMTVDAIAVEHVRDWFASMTTCWRAVCEDANFGRLRLHDLRHTAASHAVMSGENLPLVGELLGHRRHRTTAGYAHLADGPPGRDGRKGRAHHRRRDGRRVRHANRARFLEGAGHPWSSSFPNPRMDRSNGGRSLRSSASENPCSCSNYRS